MSLLNQIDPINSLLLDPEVTEVMVNGPTQVYCERKGELKLTSIQFRDIKHVMSTIENFVSLLGKGMEIKCPIVETRLLDGARVSAIIPPLALNGPTLIIRKYSKDRLTIRDLININTLTEEAAIFLEACVKNRLNIFVCGGAGTGKTTLLNLLSTFIPQDERIVMVEELKEIQLSQKHVISLELRPSNIEKYGALSIRDLVKKSIQLKSERIIIGEVRGEEAFDILQAMNLRRNGFLVSGYSNSPKDMMTRIETMVRLTGADMPIRKIRQQIAEGLDIIIQLSRLNDGSRKITKITEVQGLEGENIGLQDIFTYMQEGVDQDGKIIGRLVPNGVCPHFMKD